MTRHRFASLAAAAIVALVAAFFVTSQRNATRDQVGIALVPSLAGDLNAVTAVAIRKGAARPNLTLHKTGSVWTVAERNDYPADLEKLRRLLTALRDARIVEEKTANPAEYAVIGVEDPAKPDSGGAEVTVDGAGGKVAVIVGKSTGQGTFVRRAAEKQSYAVEPAISFETDPKFWIDSRLLDAPGALIQTIDVKLAGGAAYVLRRLNPADNTFTLEGVPAGRKALDAAALAPGPGFLNNLTAEDVAPAAGVDFGQASQTTVTLTDGNVLTLTGAVNGEKHWIEVKSTKNSALNARAAGRAFEIASYQYDTLFKPLEQLLVAKETPPPKQQSATGGKHPGPAAPPGAGKSAPAHVPPASP